MTELHGDLVVLHTVVPGDVPELLRILRMPEVRRWWRDEAEREGPFDDERWRGTSYITWDTTG